MTDKLSVLDFINGSDFEQPQDQAFLERQFGLLHNPFPPSGIADASANRAPLRDETVGQIVQFIKNSFTSGRTEYLVIKGDYGTGKTHTLRFIEHTINERMNKGEGSPRAIYVERPRIEANELNRTIMRSLGYDTIRKYIWFAIRTRLLEEIKTPTDELKDFQNKIFALTTKGRKKSTAIGFDFDDGNTTLTKSLSSKIFSKEALLDYRNFFGALQSQGLSREDSRFYLSHLLLEAVGGDRSTELAEAGTALLIARDEKSFTSWQNMLSITGSKAATSLYAPTFLQFLLEVMKLNGIPYVYLLLDEFEEVPQGFLLTAKQRQDYLYTMREVFNRIQHGLGVVIAISPGGYDALAGQATPFLDVLPTVIDLPQVSAGDAITLVDYYVKLAVNESTQQNPKPFLTEEDVAYVVQHFPTGVQRTPRNLVQLLHQIVNYIGEQKLVDVKREDLQTVIANFAGMKGTGKSSSIGRRSTPNAVEHAN